MYSHEPIDDECVGRLYLQKVDVGCYTIISRDDTGLHHIVTIFECTVIFKYV